MTYYYAARNDKEGHRLLTSYGTSKMCDKYGVGENVRKHKGLFLLEHKTGKVSAVDSAADYNPEEHAIVRSRITNANPRGVASGKFRILEKNAEGHWEETEFAGDHYGGMNTIMKALAGTRGDLVIVEDVVVRTNGSYTPTDDEF